MPRYARLGPLEQLRARCAKRIGGRRELRLRADRFGDEHRHGHEWRVRGLDGQRNCQHQQRRHFVDDLRTAAPPDFFEDRQPRRKVAGHAVCLVQHVARRGIQYGERLIECALERGERTLSLRPHRRRKPVIARCSRHWHGKSRRRNLILIDGGHVETSPQFELGARRPLRSPLRLGSLDQNR